MARSKSLYLLGGDNQLLEQVAAEMLQGVGAREPRVALLLAGSERMSKHLPNYIDPFMRCGAAAVDLVSPDGAGAFDYAAAEKTIQDAAVIYIGGGNTTQYLQLYATEPLRSVICEQYEQGVPIAGLSAGVLTLCDRCAVRKNLEDFTFEVQSGLGLIKDLTIGVHFDGPGRLEFLLDAMTAMQNSRGIGIDSFACVLLQDSQVQWVWEKYSQAAYAVAMTDPTTKAYTMTKLTEASN